MIKPRDLTTLDAAKSFVSNKAGSVDDALIQLFINGASLAIEKWLDRKLALDNYTERRNGNGTSMLPVRNWPLVSVQSLVVGDTTLQPAPLTNGQPSTTGGGYIFDDQIIYLRPGSSEISAGCFWRGYQNVLVTYQAGFITPGLLALSQLPAWAATSQYQKGSQVVANGFVFTAMVAGTSGNTQPTWPSILAGTVTDGTVQWSATDTYAGVVSGALFLPEPIETACMQLVGLVYRQRDRIGDTGEGMGQERVNYFMGALNQQTKWLLQPYRNVTPPWNTMGP
ncbi:MAG: phage gp6-like head-tail connector protein [Patescibacteria group bacterium]|nr:phage gp6-like head-tail connector protein [Patescibacteria group bacterium]